MRCIKWINSMVFANILLMMFVNPTRAQELEIDIQVIGADDTADTVANRIQLPSFLNNRVSAAAERNQGKASENNPNLTGDLPGQGRGRSEHARQASREKVRAGNSQKPDRPSEKPNTLLPSRQPNQLQSGKL